MGLFKKLRKVVKKVVKIAKVAAPIGAQFFPGGGVISQVLTKTQGLREKVDTARQYGSDMRNALRGRGLAQKLTGRRGLVNQSSLWRSSGMVTPRPRRSRQLYERAPAFRTRHKGRKSTRRHGRIAAPTPTRSRSRRAPARRRISSGRDRMGRFLRGRRKAA